MATPFYTFRLAKETARRMDEVARIYGTNTSAFLREMINAICGGTPEGPGPFLQRLGEAIGRQRQLDLFAATQAPPVAAPKRAVKRRARVKGAKRRVRTT